MEVENIVRNWEMWLSHCLSTLPHRLVQRKMSVAQQFVQALKRQAAFIHLAQVRESYRIRFCFRDFNILFIHVSADTPDRVILL